MSLGIELNVHAEILLSRGRRNAERATSAPRPARRRGIVMIHASRMLRATPQRTLRTPPDEPTPMIALEMTCVVETGIPNDAAVRITVAAVVSAAKPWTGSSLTTR